MHIVHVFVKKKWCTVGYLLNTWWDLWHGCIVASVQGANESISFLDNEVLQEKARAQQEKAEMVAQGKSILKELILHIFFILVVVSISYGTNDQNSYYVFKTVSDMFFSTFQEKVRVGLC